MGIYIMSVDQYDKLIPVFGTTGNKWPQMRLFLNMVKDNYEKTNSVQFEARKYDEADAKSYKDATGAAGTASSQFACFLNELLDLLDARPINASSAVVGGAAAGATYPAAGGIVDPRAAGATQSRIPGASPRRARVGTAAGGIVGPIQSAQNVVKALKDGIASEPWFGEFMEAITEGRIADVNDNFTFKDRLAIITDLQLNNLFTGLQGTVIGDARATSGSGDIGTGVTTRLAAAGTAANPAADATQLEAFLAQYAIGGAGNSECRAFAGAGIPISFNWDKYVLGSLLKAAVKSASSRTSSFFDVSTPTGPLENAYYRKVGDTANLYTMVNGVETAVQIGSDEAKKLKMGANCYDLGMKSGNAGEQANCFKLIKNCLAGNDIGACKQFMKNNNYWNAVKDDIAKTNLDLARQLLESFGFPVLTEDNQEAGMKLKVFANANQWLQHLADNKFGKAGTTFSDNDIKAIAANVKLVGYLDALVAKVNRNPGVLNPDYSKDGPNNTSRAFAGNRLSSYGITGKYVRQGSGTPSVSSVIALQNAVMRKRSALAIYYGIPLSSVGYVMRGGGAAVQQFEDMQNNNLLPLRLSKVVEEHYEQFVNSLKSANKDLDQKDKNDITKLIADLKVVEDKLFKAAIYTSKYQDLVSVFGQEDTQGLITLDHLQEFVDKRNNYFTRVGKQQDALTSILKALANATQKESTGLSVS